jgi:NADH-quinone oxidoreductase subunit L
MNMLLQEGTASLGLFSLAPLVVFIPVAGLLINILFGRRFSEVLVGTVASLAAGLSFGVAVLLAVALAGHPEGATVPFLTWIDIGELHVPWAFRVDTLSVTMMLVVAGVGTLIHIYSIGYMHEDVRFQGDPGRFRRFFVYLNLFIAAMMILVSADNYLMLFVGWEGVGLCSFLLIGFWFEKGKDGIGNALAAKKAFVVNRVGDFGFLIALFMMYWAFKSFEFEVVLPQARAMAEIMPNVILGITLFMLLGVAGKSAQIPLYVWLPDAMAGPTPVSALIHAATMVTAGVYLVARSYALYVEVPQAQNTVALVGAATALFAATIAVGQFDIKRVLAYSTISQLGFMVAAVGMGAFVAGMFHLVTHAFFKALLFLGSGSVILGVEHGHHHVEHDPHLKKAARGHGQGEAFNPQDMRNMGGLKERMRTTYWVYLIGALALAGIPPLAGFWSKDEILAEGLHLNPTAFILLLIAAAFTAFYMGRQVFLVFFGQPRSAAAEHAAENPPVITVPIMVLAGLSVIGGFINLPVRGLHFFSEWLTHSLGGEAAHGAEAAAEGGAEAAAAAEPLFTLNWGVAILATLLALAGIALAWYLYRRVYLEQQSLPRAKRPDDPLRGFLGPVFTGMENKWWVDELYHYVIVRPYQWLSAFLADVIDWRFWHDWFHDVVIAGGYTRLARLLAYPVDLGIIDRIANGLADLTKMLAGSLRRIQTGFVSNYALSVFLGVVIIIGYLILR